MGIIGRGRGCLFSVVPTTGRRAKPQGPINGTGRWLSALHGPYLFSILILTQTFSKGNRERGDRKT